MSALIRATILFVGALAIVPAHAQPASSGPGRGFRLDRSNTAGWPMMTSQERMEHRKKMRSMKNYDECQAYLTEHHKQMEARAKERGRAITPPRYNACDRMKERGLIK